MNRGSLIRRTLVVATLLGLLGALAFTSSQLRDARAAVASARGQAQVVRARLDSFADRYRDSFKEYGEAEAEVARSNVIMDAMKRALLAKSVRSVKVSQCDLGLADQGRYRGDSAYYKGIPPICSDHGFVVVSTQPSARSTSGEQAESDDA
jgi:type II secretory pathway pseudopilin PulG